MPQAWNPSGNDHLIRFDSGGRRLLVGVHHYFLLALSIGFGLSAVRSGHRMDHLIRFDSGGRRLLVEVHHYFLLALSIGFGLSAFHMGFPTGQAL